MRKRDMIVGLAKAGLSSTEIAERVGTTVNSVNVVCSRARASGVDIPYSRERRATFRNEGVITLTEQQVEKIVRRTGLVPQQFVELMIKCLPSGPSTEVRE